MSNSTPGQVGAASNEVAEHHHERRQRAIEELRHLRQTEAPPSNLPSWDDCAIRVENSNKGLERVATGGYGVDDDLPHATELHRFIHEYDDADPRRSAWFRYRLERLIHSLTGQEQP